MKRYVHARLGKEDGAVLEDLKRATGHTESELVRRGLRLVLEEVGMRRTALDLAGSSTGRFKGGPRDLASDGRHLRGFGE